MAEATHILKILIKVMGDATAPLTKVQKNIENIDKTVGHMKRTFDFTFFSFLFTGMAIQRFSQNLLRGITGILGKIEGYISPASKAILGMQAAFEYLKFSIFNALNQSALFMNVTNWLTTMIDRLSDFMREHPKISELIMEVGGVGFVVGAGLTAMGVLMQLGKLIAAIFGMTGLTFMAEFALGFAAVTMTISLGLLIGDFLGFEETVKKEGILSAVLDLLGGIFAVVGSAMLFSPEPTTKAIGAVIITLGLIIQFRDPIFKWVNEKWKSVLGGAALGASLGLPFGGIGAFFGAIGGGAIGGATDFLKKETETLDGFSSKTQDLGSIIINNPFRSWENMNTEVTKTPELIGNVCSSINPTLSETTDKTFSETIMPNWNTWNTSLSTADNMVIQTKTDLEALPNISRTITYYINYVGNIPNESSSSLRNTSSVFTTGKR